MLRRASSTCGIVLCLCSSAVTFADYTHTVADPAVAFAVIDNSPFDGHGDDGPFTYFTVLRGTIGEERSSAEFDISGFSVPPGESVASAILQVQVSHNVGGGMGCPWGQRPDYLAAHGYIGDGVAGLSDFEAGDANFLDRVPTSDAAVGDVLSFDVTNFVSSLVGTGQSWVGLTVQAESIGSLAIWDAPVGYPSLTIQTATVPEPAGSALLAAGLLLMRRR
jgi:hypothetical protein